MSAGKGVLVHCRQGVGRAGMIAACVLLRLGCAANASNAIQHVRKQRHKCAVQTSRQEEFVHWYAANMMITPISSLPERPPFANRAYCGANTNRQIRKSSTTLQQEVDVHVPQYTRERRNM